jgi:hypothetical protein
MEIARARRRGNFFAPLRVTVFMLGNVVVQVTRFATSPQPPVPIWALPLLLNRLESVGTPCMASGGSVLLQRYGRRTVAGRPTN